MSVWTSDQAFDWYKDQGWLVGCNFLPSSCINQIEMFQESTFNIEEIAKEISWAKNIGFNSLRVYLHDLLWEEKHQFLVRFNDFLDCCQNYEIKPVIVLFDDCHYPFPELGPQPLPVRGIHNSGWKQSPGHKIVTEIFKLNAKQHLDRLQKYTQELLELYKDDARILMWDLYNEPGQFGIGEKSFTFLEYVWNWAHEIRPSQPLTSCIDGAIGDSIISLNKIKSDIITFHTYEAEKLEPTIIELRSIGRPLMCTEYMAREYGTTFEFCLPIFKKYNIACYNWGLVAGRSQTNFNWETILHLNEQRDQGNLIYEGDSLTEPDEWFHDIFRQDGSSFKDEETAFIKKILLNEE
ncbi:1,4-beta-xylanase [Gammaproteobacteria bacterium]|nr:1,4-beta-xylanase [Gammaproteobacteria bacterium]MDC1021741.1 1,4-beta-xylanase [Gammaproteobacteria bacterium]